MHACHSRRRVFAIPRVKADARRQGDARGSTSHPGVKAGFMGEGASVRSLRQRDRSNEQSHSGNSVRIHACMGSPPRSRWYHCTLALRWWAAGSFTETNAAGDASVGVAASEESAWESASAGQVRAAQQTVQATHRVPKEARGMLNGGQVWPCGCWVRSCEMCFHLKTATMAMLSWRLLAVLKSLAALVMVINLSQMQDKPSSELCWANFQSDETVNLDPLYTTTKGCCQQMIL